MKFTNEDMAYFLGRKFSNGYQLQLIDNPIISRLDCILKITKEKRILHIGCCDHIPLIEEKINNKRWLHGLLLDNCLSVVGVDINKEAVHYVMNNVLPLVSPPPPCAEKSTTRCLCTNDIMCGYFYRNTARIKGYVI
jgi:hypothetical protein